MKIQTLITALTLSVLSQPVSALIVTEPVPCAITKNETVEDKISSTIKGYFTARMTRQYDLLRGLLAKDAQAVVRVNDEKTIEINGREEIIQAYKNHSSRITAIEPLAFNASIDPNSPLNPKIHYELIITIQNGDHEEKLHVSADEEHTLNVTKNGVIEIKEIFIDEHIFPL